MLFITENCWYCFYVTAWFLERWNKLWKSQQGSLLNIKSMHYICWNPGEPKAAKPNSRVCSQQELCGKCLHLDSKFGLLAVILWSLFGGSSVQMLELRDLPAASSNIFDAVEAVQSLGCTREGNSTEPLRYSRTWWRHHPKISWLIFGFGFLLDEKFSTFFFLCWKTGSSLSWPNIYRGVKKSWKVPNTHVQTLVKLTENKKEAKNLLYWSLRMPEVSLSSHSLCTQESIRKPTKIPSKLCATLCSVLHNSGAAPTTAHSDLSGNTFKHLNLMCMRSYR